MRKAERRSIVSLGLMAPGGLISKGSIRVFANKMTKRKL
jgi:hypothetical protein